MKKGICDCGHEKYWHSLDDKSCLFPVTVICKQDKTWYVGYCTCMKYKEKTKNE